MPSASDITLLVKISMIYFNRYTSTLNINKITSAEFLKWTCPVSQPTVLFIKPSQSARMYEMTLALHWWQPNYFQVKVGIFQNKINYNYAVFTYAYNWNGKKGYRTSIIHLH
jgi:hypothetical protein